jgi:hypothetical protein
MPTQRKPQPRSRKEPGFMKLAHRFYGEAFDVKRLRQLSAAMADWSELTEDEQSFTVAHLHYLNLLAQARTQKLLLQVRDLLDEVAEGLGDVLDPEDDEDQDEDDDQEHHDEITLDDDEGFDGDAELPPEPEDLHDDAEPVLEDDQDDAEPLTPLPPDLEE